MKKISINPKKRIFYWGPADGKPIFPDYWNSGLHRFSQDYKPGWPDNFVYFKKEKLTYVCEYGKLYDNGEIIFRKNVLDRRRFKKAYKKWNIFLKDFGKIKKEIERIDLARLSDESLKDLFLIFQRIYNIDFWRHSMLPEMANWGGEQMLVRELRQRIKRESDFIHALERLTAPEDYSFYQKEELELLQIKFLKKKSEREKQITAHQRKYFWMHNSYHHAQVLPVSYFKKILSAMTKNQAQRKISEIRNLRSGVKKHKLEITKKYNLPKEVLFISQGLSFCIWWQDIRKAYIFQANHLIDLFLRELSRRFGAAVDDFYFYTAAELEKYFGGKPLGKDEIRNRKKSFLIYLEPEKMKTTLFSGREAKKIFSLYSKKKNVGGNVKELKGLVVNRGIARGRAKILYSPKDAGKMKKGDILVTTMTTPDFILALKKAAAVVTDEGGMTCHAAIVSRELKIPGIVATKIATRVLKDGDLVEVNADKGVIKIIEKK